MDQQVHPMTSMPRINPPKRVVSFIGQFIGFMFTSLFKYWYLSLLFILLTAGLSWYFDLYSLGFYIGSCCTLLLLVTGISVYQALHEKYSNFNIAYYGCYTIREGEYLTADVDSEILNSKIKSLSEKYLKALNVYRNSYIEAQTVQLPKFLSLLFSYDKLDGYVKKQVRSQKHLSSLYFLRDSGKQSITPVFHFDTETLENTYPVTYAERLISELDEQPIKTVEIGYMAFILMHSTALNTIMLETGEFQLLHDTLTEAEKIIFDIRTAANSFSEAQKERIIKFADFWEAYLNYTRVIIFIAQKQYMAAAQRIFKTIQLNPYFPYESYEKLKLEYSARYALQMLPGMQEFGELLNFEDNTDYSIVAQKLEAMISFGQTEYMSELLNEIIHAAKDKHVEKFIETELDKLDESNTFALLTKSEVIRYIPNGEEKINQIYAANVDKAIRLLRAAIEKDKDFTILKSKLGALLFVKGVHYNNEQILDEGAKLTQEGQYILQELGVIPVETNT